MATAEALPGSLSLAFRRGDEYGTLIDFSTAVTGWTWSASVYSAVHGGTLATPAITIVDAAAGQVNLALSELQTASLPAGTHGWRLEAVQPGNVKRTLLEGFCEVTA